MRYIQFAIIVLAIACSFSSCKKEKQITIGEEMQQLQQLLVTYQDDLYEESVLEPFISCNSIPEIDDLESYFSDVPTKVLLPTECSVHSEPIDSIDRPIFEEKIHRLQQFKEGQIGTFPLDILEYARLNEQKINCDMGHRGNVAEFAYSFLFQYRLMQQIVRICPDITMLTNYVSVDKNVAYDDMYSTANSLFYHTQNAYLFLRLPDGTYATDRIDTYPYYVDTILIVSENDTSIQYSVTGLREMSTPIYNKKTHKWINQL
jgi:hypothetical protein